MSSAKDGKIINFLWYRIVFSLKSRVGKDSILTVKAKYKLLVSHLKLALAVAQC